MKEKNKRLINGSYSMIITIIVIAAAVILNLIVNSLPAKLMQKDFSSARLYTLTDTTVKYLETLDKDVELYYICEGGKEDDTISKLLDRYDDESARVSVKQIDPALYPGFTSQYTDESVANNSVIAVCGDRSKVVSEEFMYITEFNYETYEDVKTGFDGEGMITSAIDYVTSDNIPVMYVLNGNGELEIPQEFKTVIAKNNVDIAELNLLTTDSVPSDAAGIIINAPVRDYTQDEASRIISYLENGGKAVIFSNYSADAMPGLDSILENYGVKRDSGIVLEGDADHYISYQYSVIPVVDYSEVTERVYTDTYLVAPMAQPIKSTDVFRSSIEQTPLLETTASAYEKIDVQNMTTSEKESGDADGPFVVGMLITEDINNDTQPETKIAYYSTGYIMDADYNRTVSGGNEKLIGDTVRYLCSAGEISSAVPAKTLIVDYLTITDAAANLWTVICVFIIPAAFLVAGGVIWLRRRKR